MAQRTSRRTRALGAALAVTATASFSGTALAQGARKVPIALSASIRHDSNVAGTGDALAGRRGLSKADQRAILSANVNLAKQFGIFQTSLTGSAGYNFYRRNTRLNREFIALDGAALATLSRCTVNLNAGYRRAQTEVGDLFLLPGTVNQIDDIRNVESRVNYGAEASCGAAIGFRPVLGISRETGTNSNPIRRFADFNRTGYTGGLRYAQPVLGTVSLLGTIESVNYPNRPRIGDEEDGYRSETVGVKFERRISTNLMGVVQVNYNHLRPRRANVGSFSGLTYSADVTGTFADRLQVRASLSRSTQPTLQSDAAYSVETLYGLNAEYAASQRLSFGLGGSYRKRRYPGAGQLIGTALSNDNRKTVNASAMLRAGDRLRFALDTSYTRRDAELSQFNYNNFGVGFTTTLAL